MKLRIFRCRNARCREALPWHLAQRDDEHPRIWHHVATYATAADAFNDLDRRYGPRST